jgi:predicted cobalt transporter CbtA
LNYVNQRRTKLISTFINLISSFYLLWPPPNSIKPEIDAIALPSCSFRVARSIWSPLCRACVFLAGCCVKFVIQRPPKATISFIFLIFCHLICRAKQPESIPPYVPLSIADTVFWSVVVCSSIVWWLSTATECIFSFHFTSLE